jgi:hypothetical protein
VSTERVRHNGNRNVPALGELDGVGRQVGEDLPQPAGIAAQAVRHVIGDMKFHVQLFGSRPHLQQFYQIPKHRPKRKCNRFYIQLAGHHFREIQDVVQDQQQGLGRVPHGSQILALFAREIGLQHHLGEPDDPAERRTHFMTRIGEACAFLFVIGYRGISIVNQLLTGVPERHGLSFEPGVSHSKISAAAVFGVGALANQLMRHNKK